jgi:hypothetical protein
MACLGITEYRITTEYRNATSVDLTGEWSVATTRLISFRLSDWTKEYR